MKNILVTICALTMIATIYLSMLVIVFRPPRANYSQWFLMAALFIAQGAVTLTALSGAVAGTLIRWLVVAGAATIIAIGAVWTHATVSGQHFEGYALVLGSFLVAQGILTLPVFLRRS